MKLYWSNKLIFSPSPNSEYPSHWKWALGSILDSVCVFVCVTFPVCVCVCVCLQWPWKKPCKPQRWKKQSHTSIDHFLQTLFFFCQGLISSSLLSSFPSLTPCLIPVSSWPNIPFFNCLHLHNVMFESLFLTFLPVKINKSPSTWQKISSLSWDAFLSLLKNVSQKARLISFGVTSENVPLFRHLGDNYEMCWTNERPDLQHCSKSIFEFSSRLKALNFLWCLWSDAWRYHSSGVKAYVWPFFTNSFLADTDPFLSSLIPLSTFLSITNLMERSCL